MKNRKKTARCEICLQPATKDYMFKLAYYEVRKKVNKVFCGAYCLKDLVEKELDKTHLDELYSPE
ncbi:hypothetical protein JW865_07720 [Candidatus Bathyarchaeota archaeon]|nr:hypothetical protein [Candidatus Bathyarchaeota archaeon]